MLEWLPNFDAIVCYSIYRIIYPILVILFWVSLTLLSSLSKSDEVSFAKRTQESGKAS